ncbi:MAG: FlgO family outer membrane protein [Myxococcaceae bacterium]
MLPLVLVALVSGANPEPVKLAATGFQFVNISKELATFCSEHFAQQLTLEGIRVTTPNEISTMLGFERQKELMGCSDKSSSCLAELANALGVDGLVTGTVGKFGKSYQVNIKVLNAADARPLAAHSARVKDEEELIEEYTRAAKQIAPALQRKLGRPVGATLPDTKSRTVTPAPVAQADSPPPARIEPTPEVAKTSTGGVRRFWWAPAAAGGVLLVGGVILMADARGKSRTLREGGDTLLLTEAESLRVAGAREQTLGGVAVGVGVAALAAGGAMWLFGAPKDQPQAAFIPLNGGGAVTVSGVLP